MKDDKEDDFVVSFLYILSFRIFSPFGLPSFLLSRDEGGRMGVSYWGMTMGEKFSTFCR